MTVGSTDLRTGLRLHSVTVQYLPGIHFSLFIHLSTDEAKWAVHELEGATGMMRA
jgi:hypothetical protein